MTGPVWKNEINLSGIIQIGMLIVALSVGWTTLKAESTSNRKDLDGAVSRLAVAEVEIAAMRTQIARQDERQASVLAILGRIEARLERLDNYARQNGDAR